MNPLLCRMAARNGGADAGARLTALVEASIADLAASDRRFLTTTSRFYRPSATCPETRSSRCTRSRCRTSTSSTSRR